MMLLSENFLITCLGFPFLGAALILLLRTQTRELVIATLPFVFTFSVFSLAFLFFYLDPEMPLVWILGSLIPGITISFAVEPLGMLFVCVLAVLWPVSMLYSLTYLRENQLKNIPLFCAWFYLAIGCTVGIAFAGDLLTLFVFYEALTLVTYPLVTHSQTPQAQRAGRIYLLFLMGSSLLLLLPALIWIWFNFKTLAFIQGGFIPSSPSNALLLLVLAFGIGKAALIPLHVWLPTAMIAPAPVSALLHAVAVVKAGVFTFLKIILFVFGVDSLSLADTSWLIYVAGTGIVVASVLALRQTDLKRRLAYSTVGQLAYIVLGAALLKPAIAGAIFHLIAHAFGKITLFFAAGAIQTATGRTRIDHLRGIGYAMPWTMTLFAVAVLSLIGLPPTAGFISKWFLIQGSISAHHYFATAMLLVSTLLSVAYFAPIVYHAFDKQSAGQTDRQKIEYCEASLGLLLPMLIGVGGILTLFFFAQPVLSLLERLL